MSQNHSLYQIFFDIYHVYYTQQKKLGKLCLMGHDKKSKTFKDV